MAISVFFMHQARRCVLWAALACLAAPSVAAEPLYVVVSARSPLQAATQKEVLALYTGRTRVLPNGEAVQPLDQALDGAARAAFYDVLAGMDLARINSYWGRLHFSGKLQPPRVVADDAAVVQWLVRDPSAIGYLTHEPSDAAIRVLLRLP